MVMMLPPVTKKEDRQTNAPIIYPYQLDILNTTIIPNPDEQQEHMFSMHAIFRWIHSEYQKTDPIGSSTSCRVASESSSSVRPFDLSGMLSLSSPVDDRCVLFERVVRLFTSWAVSEFLNPNLHKRVNKLIGTKTMNEINEKHRLQQVNWRRPLEEFDTQWAQSILPQIERWCRLYYAEQQKIRTQKTEQLEASRTNAV